MICVRSVTAVTLRYMRVTWGAPTDIFSLLLCEGDRSVFRALSRAAAKNSLRLSFYFLFLFLFKAYNTGTSRARAGCATARILMSAKQ